MGALKLAFRVAWKSIALVLAGLLVGVVLILSGAALLGGGIGDPCPPYC